MAESTVTVRNNIPILNEAILAGLSESLEKGALVFEAKMSEAVASGKTPPPLKPATIAAKGSSATLVDTGEMLGQITSEVKDDVARIGVMGSRADIAAIHEFGAPAAGIPERSFIRRTANDSMSREKANKDVIAAMREKIEKAKLK